MKFFHFLPLIFATISAFSVNDTRLPDVEIKGRVLDGSVATTDRQFPYQVGLELQATNHKYSWCGGALISKKLVLTSARCLWHVERANVYLGSIVRLKGQRVFAPKKDFIIHHGFNFNTAKDNIALIKIPTVALTNKVNIARLPSTIDLPRSTYYHTFATASGWGKPSKNNNALSDHLRWANFEVITNAECKKKYKKLPEHSICISPTNSISPSCGDDGGPLILKGSKILIGIATSVYYTPEYSNMPAVFVRVVDYLDWIKQNMNTK